jgi:acyl-CoA synthetase (NDP forming)
VSSLAVPGVGAVPDLARLFSAASIALVGASERSIFAHNLVRNLRDGGFKGDIHIVHPRHESQFGLSCVSSLVDVPGAVDVAYLLTGPESFAPVLVDCGRKGVPWAVVLSGGFKEMGKDGAEREALLAETARANGVEVIGPNALGFLSSSNGLGAFGNPLTTPLLAGGISLVSHSGGMAVFIHQQALGRAVGMARMVALGNCAMVSAPDVIEYLVDDPETRVIAGLLETLEPADRFVHAARRAVEAGKPIVLVKLGRSKQTHRVAVAHTGVIAGEDRVVDGVLRQLGVLRVSALEELVEVAGLLATKGWPKGPRVAFMAGSGGASGLIADLAYESGLELPDISAGPKARLAEVTRGYAACQNPLDLTGFLADPAVYAEAASVLAGDPAFDAVVTMVGPPAEPDAASERKLAVAQGVQGAIAAAGVYGVLTAPIAGELQGMGRAAVLEQGLYYGNGIALTVLALGRAAAYASARERVLSATVDSSLAPAGELPTGPATLTELETFELLRQAGVASVECKLTTSPEQAAEAAGWLGFPVVLKVQSPDVLHKTDAGGVVTHVGSREEAAAAYRTILAAVRGSVPDARIHGVLVARQHRPVVELLLGVSRDPQFGPTVTLAAGGVLAELLGDAATRVPPLGSSDVVDMLSQLRIAPLLAGHRGGPAGDTAALVAAVERVAALAHAMRGTLLELDINPLFVLPEGEGIVAADGLAVLG